MAKDDKPLTGMDVFADFLVGNKIPVIDKPNDDVDNDKFQDIDPDDLQKKLGDDTKVDDKKTDDKVDDKKVDKSKKVDTKVDDKSVDDIKPVDDKTVPDELDEYESEISSFFANQLAKKLGIADEDLKVNKVDEVVELMSEIIAENSKPVYASEEVEAYDEFVRNGGNLREFYKELHSGRLNADSVDLENEQDQIAVVKENLINQGYKEDKIKKMISRYKENETLKEEAEDALDLVKEYNRKKAESLLVEQKKQAEAAEKAQQKFYRDVNDTIKTMSDVRGIPITDKDKREVLRYAFYKEDDGLTKFQKDSRDVRNILELAYLLMNKDKKIDNANKKDNTDAYKILRDRLKAKGSKIDDNQKGKDLGSSSLGDFGRGIIF